MKLTPLHLIVDEPNDIPSMSKWISEQSHNVKETVLQKVANQLLGRDALPSDAERFTLISLPYTDKQSLIFDGRLIGYLFWEFKASSVTYTFEPYGK